MTNKHFIKLADWIKYFNEIHKGEVQFTDRHINLLAQFCESCNPNFNRQLWLDYIAGKCGPSGGKVK